MRRAFFPVPLFAARASAQQQDNKTVASVLVGGKVKRDFGFQYRALSEKSVVGMPQDSQLQTLSETLRPAARPKPSKAEA